MLSRRSVLAALTLLGWARGAFAKTVSNTGSPVNPLRIRTLTAGVNVSGPRDIAGVERAMEFLGRARKTFESSGYEVQTTRVATSSWVAGLDAAARTRALRDLEALDRIARERNMIVSIGPVLRDNRDDAALAQWTDELVRVTRSISFSVVIANGQEIFDRSALSAARTMLALSRSLPNGMANFRFAAAANIPAGTPFFPVAWHDGAESLAIGMESASVVEEAFRSADGVAGAGERLTSRLDLALKPIQDIAQKLAAEAERAWLGIDTSPAPGQDRSIAAGIEAFTRAPFGAAGTLEACGVITAAIKSVSVRTCGYSGLMLPVLEDPLLAQRAGEGRFTIRDLLLYSSVCGTGLDVVPIPGDTPVEAIAGLLRDVAALSARLRKPLSARLFLVPGGKAGEIARFDDPLLTDCAIMKVD